MARKKKTLLLTPDLVEEFLTRFVTMRHEADTVREGFADLRTEFKDRGLDVAAVEAVFRSEMALKKASETNASDDDLGRVSKSVRDRICI